MLTDLQLLGTIRTIVSALNYRHFPFERQGTHEVIDTLDLWTAAKFLLEYTAEKQ